MNTVILGAFVGTAVAADVTYNMMVNRLRRRCPAVRSVDIAWTSPVGPNFRLFRELFKGDRRAMRLWRAAKILRWMLLALLPFAIMAYCMVNR